MNNTTICSLDLYSEFVKRTSKSARIIIRVCYIIIFLVALIQIFDMIKSNSLEELIFVILCFILSILFFLFDVFYVKINIKKSNAKKLIGAIFTYIFTDEGLEVLTKKGEQILAKEFVNYTLVEKVIFSDDAMFIYPNSVSSYLVDMKGFEKEEDKDKVISLLKTHIKNVIDKRKV